MPQLDILIKMRNLFVVYILFSSSFFLWAQDDSLRTNLIPKSITFRKSNKIKSFGSDSLRSHLYLRKSVSRLEYIEKSDEDLSSITKISFNISGKIKSLIVYDSQNEVVTEIAFKNGKITSHLINYNLNITEYYNQEYLSDTIISLSKVNSIKYSSESKTKLYYTSDSNTNSPLGIWIMLNKNMKMDNIVQYDKYNSLVLNLRSNGRVRNLILNDVYNNSIKASFSNFRDALLFLEYKYFSEKKYISIRPSGKVRFINQNGISYRFRFFRVKKRSLTYDYPRYH